MSAHATYQLRVFKTAATLSGVAAAYIVAVANKAINARGRFVIALSGGHTPLEVYAQLAQLPLRNEIQWDKTFIFWGDERCVPLADPENNAHQARSILLDKITIPLANIYPIPVNLLPAKAATAYEKELKLFFGEKLPQFDLILLGLGTNGHTASLFPGTKILKEQMPGVKEVEVTGQKIFRVSMTAPLINLARNILFLVTGADKAIILKEVLTGAYNPDKYPAQLIHPPQGKLSWFVDEAAATELPPLSK